MKQNNLRPWEYYIYIILCFIAIPSALFYVISTLNVTFGIRHVMRSDEWYQWLDLLSRNYPMNVLISERLHNIMIPLNISYFDILLTKGNSHFISIAGIFACISFISLYIYSIYLTNDLSILTSIFIFFSILGILFSAGNFLFCWPSGGMILLVNYLFVFFTLALLTLFVYKSQIRYFVLMLLSAATASYCWSAGIGVFTAVIILILKSKKSVLLKTITAVFALSFLFYHVLFGVGAESKLQLGIIETLSGLIKFFPLVCGSLFYQILLPLGKTAALVGAYIIGTILLIFSLWRVFKFIFSSLSDIEYKKNALFIGVYLFVFFFFWIVFMGRVVDSRWNPITTAITYRYLFHTVIFTINCVLHFYFLTRSRNSSLQLISLFILLTILISCHPRFSFLTDMQYRQLRGRESWAISYYFDDMSRFDNNKVVNNPRKKANIKKLMPIIKEKKLNFFSWPEFDLLEKNFRDHFMISDTPCMGQIDGIKKIPEKRDVFRISGWAWEEKGVDKDAYVVLRNQKNSIIGIARFTSRRPDLVRRLKNKDMEWSGWFGYIVENSEKIEAFLINGTKGKAARIIADTAK